MLSIVVGSVIASLGSSSFIEVGKMRPMKSYSEVSEAPKDYMHEVIFAVKQKNLDVMEREVLERSTPGSAKFRQWMNFDEVGALTSNVEGAESIMRWLSSKNIEVSWASAHKDYLKATASVERWEDVLNTKFSMYRNDNNPEHPHVPRAKNYFLPHDIAPHVSSIFKVANLPTEIRHYGRRKELDSEESIGLRKDPRSLATNTPTTISFLSDLYDVTDLVGDSRVIQSVFETNDESMSQSDLSQFQNEYGCLQQAALDVGGYQTTMCGTDDYPDGPDCYEGNLDIQYIMGMAQNVTSYYWHVNGYDAFTDYLVEISDAGANMPLVNSISWGSDEQSVYPSVLDSFNTEAMKVAAMGVTIMVSSGDDGVNTRGGKASCSYDTGSAYSLWTGEGSWSGVGYIPSFPATSPWVTAVGGTMGPNTGAVESVCQSNKGGVITSGGGFSTYYPAPEWQTAAVSNYFDVVSPQPTDGYNPKGRAYPDVSMLATEYEVIVNGETVALYGTSASSPLFASFVSLVNSKRKANGLPPVGYLNPTLWSNPSLFDDVTTGINNCQAGSPANKVVCCSAGFTAAAGWDPASGWGSITLPNLETLVGTTTNVMPTYAPTLANQPSFTPTAAPTGAMGLPGYVVTVVNKGGCPKNLNGLTSNYVITGEQTGSCILVESPFGPNYSIKFVVTDPNDVAYVERYNYTTSTDCTGSYIASPVNAFEVNACFVDGSYSIYSYFFPYAEAIWKNFTNNGVIFPMYDSSATCANEGGDNAPSTFVWYASGACLGGIIYNCDFNVDPTMGDMYPVNVNAYDSLNCKGSVVQSGTYDATMCAVVENDDSVGDDNSYYYYYNNPTVAESYYCSKGTNGSSGSGSGSSSSDLSDGAVAGIVIVCIAVVAVVGVYLFMNRGGSRQPLAKSLA